MNKIIKYVTLLVCVIGMSSCVKQKLEVEYTNQENKIDSYVTKTKKDTMTVSYNGGSTRLTLKQGTGEALEQNGAVSFYYAGYVFTSNPSALFATNHKETAEGSGFALTDEDYQIYEADMRDNGMLEGLRNGLIGVKSGEMCEIAFSGKYGFGDEVFGTIPVNSALLYKIWVVGVSNE